MEYFEADINLDATNELDTDDSENLLEKMDDYQFTRFVENHCIHLQQSQYVLDEECTKQEPENSLVWEKSFENRILLDVDDDFNLSSEICDSYTIFLSQSSAEDVSLNIAADDIGKIENGYDGSDENELLTTEESRYEHNQDIHNSSYSGKHDETKDNLESRFQEYKLEMAGNTTDEEQEELPYDGNLQTVSEHHTDENPDLVDHMPPLTRLFRNLSGHVPVSRVIQTIPFRDQRSTVENTFSQEVPDNELSTEAEASSYRSKSELNFLSEDTADILVSKHGTKLENGFPVEHNQLSGGRASIAESLLRFFSEEDLALSSTMYIDSETLPETSFTESIDKTVIKNHISSVASNDLFVDINKFTKSETDLSRKQEIDSKFASEKEVLQHENDSHDSGPTRGSVENNGTYGPENPLKIIQEKNIRVPLSLETILKMGRTISYNEIKYGKWKQHYPLPDFSKVEPKVKIPKRNTSNNYNPGRPIIKKTKSSPNLSESRHAAHKSAVVVVQEVLDSTQPSVSPTRTEVNNKKQSMEANHSPELFQQLQEEFDKLLIKYAEAENTIDQLRFGAKVSVPSDSNQNQMIQSGILSSRCQITTLTGPQRHQAQSGSTSDAAILFTSESAYNNCPMSFSVASAGTTPASCQPITEVYKATEADQMARKLNKHIEYFKHQVEDFQKCLNSRSISLEDVQWELKELREGQDKLERSYIAAKDKHRSLQQRHYLDKNITAGDFDPDREIEGEIFRIGMQLENIKEKIDEDICNQSSPINSVFTSTPLSTHESLCSESNMAAIIQEGLKVGRVTQDSFQMELVPEEMPEDNSKSSLLEDRCNHVPQRDQNKSSKIPAQAADFFEPDGKLTSHCWMHLASIHTIEDEGCRAIAEPIENVSENHIEPDPEALEQEIPTVRTKAPSTLTENNLHSSVYPNYLSMNETLRLHSTSFQGQESLNKLKQLSPDNRIARSEGCRHTTATQTLDSEQPQTERYSSFCESMPSFKAGLHNTNREASSTHTSEDIIEEDNNKIRQLLQLADPSGCNPFNRLKPTIGVEDSAAPPGNAFLDLDLLPESSDDHLPLPIPQQCTPKTFLQQTNCGTIESEDLSQPWSTRNEILELQYEVSKLKQKLEESLSKLSNQPKIKEVSKPPSQEQRHRSRSCRRKKTSSTSRSMENVKLTTNCLNSLKRRHSSWLRADDDASDHELKLFSERSSGQSRRRLTSSIGISAAVATKCTEMLASISPLRYDTIEYPPISSVSRIYYSPTYEIVKIGSKCLPNQFHSTKSLLINDIDRSTGSPQISHLNSTLDKAVEAANNMKKTTRRMIKILSADLAKAEYYKYLYDW
ncbi:serine-rich adhesin for platelets-like isoform X3 [Heterodontus francisci]|uniref:serine-rich adhesin for platelets-like isoform X3 n=1 Tax=Heterodontus francisci TaxID=7792 RepID=UPI00355B7579